MQRALAADYQQVYCPSNSSIRWQCEEGQFLTPVYVCKASHKLQSKTMPRGNAIDQSTLRHWSITCSNAYALLQQQVLEMRDVDKGKQKLLQINDSVLAVADLDVHRYMQDQRDRVVLLLLERCVEVMVMTMSPSNWDVAQSYLNKSQTID
jgi:hypothetical protein